MRCLRLLPLVVAATASCHERPPRTPAAPVAPAAAPTFTRGVNVNHWLASNYDQGGADGHDYGAPWFDGEDVAWIADHGFDHIRLRTRMDDWLRPDGTLDPAALAPLDAVLAWCRARHLGLVVAATSVPGVRGGRLASADAAVAAGAATTWGLVARRYAAVGDELRFELFHHPDPSAAPELARLLQAELAAVRVEDRRRFVYVTTPAMDFAGIAGVRWPDDPRVGLALSFWQPRDFTFQVDPDRPRLAFPAAEPARSPAAIDAAFAALARAREAHAPGRELYVAEWGVYHAADAASQQAYLTAVHAALTRHHLPWAIYDYDSGCAMRGGDGTPTVAYAALGLGPATVERRFALLERARRVEGGVVLRQDGASLGLSYAADEDRRRTSRFTLDGDGLPTSYQTFTHPAANDRWGVTSDERWQRGPDAIPAFYLPRQDDPLLAGLVAGWLTRHPGASLRLEPTGAATATVVAEQTRGGERLTAVAVDGLDLDPIVVWLDRAALPVAIIDELGGHVTEAHVADVPALLAAQQVALAERATATARHLVHRPRAGLVIRHAAVFDPVHLRRDLDRAIVITGGTITAIGADAELATPPGFDELDATGRTVLPGLWDTHAHLFGRSLGLLALAAGVTTVRELGNELDLPAQVARYDRGLELGPRTVTALRLGAPWVPLAPTVATEAEARALVDDAVARGYAELKVLDETDPTMVPVLGALAHARGLRFSGHLPRALTLDQFVAAGADELHHVTMLFRGQPRESRAWNDEVARRVALLASHHVRLDPTLSQFAVAAGASGHSPAELAALPRLPPALRRAVERTALSPEDAALYRAAYPAYQRAVQAALEAGVVVLAGTDGALPGWALVDELSTYVAAGVSPARALRMATLDAAQALGRADRSGSIAVGKDADLVLVEGDPTADLAALRAVERVILGGALLDPRQLLAAIHVRRSE